MIIRRRGRTNERTNERNGPTDGHRHCAAAAAASVAATAADRSSNQPRSATRGSIVRMTVPLFLPSTRPHPRSSPASHPPPTSPIQQHCFPPAVGYVSCERGDSPARPARVNALSSHNTQPRLRMCETTTVVGMREKQFRLIHGFIISVNGGVTTS